MLRASQKGVRKKYIRGMGLFSSVLALSVFAALVLGILAMAEEWRRERRMDLAAAQLAVLSDALRDHVAAEFTAILATLSTAGPSEVDLRDLRSAGYLEEGFPDRDVLGRPFRVALLPDGNEAFVSLVTTEVPGDDDFYPGRARLNRHGDIPLGIVALDDTGFVSGPMTRVDVSAFQGAFAGLPAARALAVVEHHDFGAIYGSQLYRVAVDGFAEANRMETAIDMDGNDIAGGGAVAAETLSLEEDLSIGNGLAVSGDLIVGTMIKSAGPASFSEVNATNATFSGDVSAANAEITVRVDAASVSAGKITGTNFHVDEVTAEDAETTALIAGEVTATTIDAGKLDAVSVEAVSVLADSVTATQAGISQLTVGSCTGC